MATDFKLPEMGEGVNEGELVRWLVKVGDTVTHDQPLVEMMTDKATVEIPSPATGKVTKLVAKEGDMVKVGQVLLSLDGAADSQSAAKPETKTAAAPVKSTSAAEIKTQAPVQAAPQPAAPQQAASQISPPVAGADVLATPSTRRYAREAGVDINSLPGSGPAGRVTRDDVMKVAGTGVGAVSDGPPSVARSAYSAPATPVTAPAVNKGPLKPLPTYGGVAGDQTEIRTPFRGIRKKIAENLVKSKLTIPHFTHMDEVDVTELVKWRASMKDEAAQYGVKLTYLPFIMKAMVTTMREFPAFNSMLDDATHELVQKKYYNVGFAADTADGLLVPNIKNVETKNILQLAKEIVTLAEKARAGKLAPDDMRNGTITITNIGSIGGLSATPIINPPEVAIIGIYEIVKRPVVINDQIVIRDMMNITATCDHRVIDGAEAARFLKKLKTRISNPQSLVMEMI